MTQVNILSGVYIKKGDYRTAYPHNLVPVPVAQGISTGYLRPADGIVAFGPGGPGPDRGAINWNGALHRVSGTRLLRIDAAGAVTDCGDVGPGGTVSMDYSFDHLAIASGGRLYYWDGTTLTQVSDSDLGTVVDMLWIAGYFMTTDGTSLVVTDLQDPTNVNPLKYGSSEADPDPVVALIKLRGEVYALNRYTTEVFSNVGGDYFPFAVVQGAQVPRGAIGTFACSLFLGSIAFVGSSRDESPAVWLIQNGDTLKLSTREVDQVLQDHTEAELAKVVVEARVDKGHQHLLIHLPDQTLVYDGAASLVVGQPVWFTLGSGVDGPAAYRGRNLVWCYDRWIVGDPSSGAVGTLTDEVATHFGAPVGWEFATQVVYNQAAGAIVHSVELIGITGRAVLGNDPTLWTSWSADGVQWSQERAISGGRRGETAKRLQWRGQGRLARQRIQKFRGTSDCIATFARLEMAVEPLAA